MAECDDTAGCAVMLRCITSWISRWKQAEENTTLIIYFINAVWIIAYLVIHSCVMYWNTIEWNNVYVFLSLRVKLKKRNCAADWWRLLFYENKDEKRKYKSTLSMVNKVKELNINKVKYWWRMWISWEAKQRCLLVPRRLSELQQSTGSRCSYNRCEPANAVPITAWPPGA